MRQFSMTKEVDLVDISIRRSSEESSFGYFQRKTRDRMGKYKG